MREYTAMAAPCERIWKDARRERPAVCGVTQPAPGGATALFLDFDRRLRLHDLAAAVVTVGADVVTQVRLAGGGVGGQRFRAQRVVRAAHATGGLGATRFLDGHDFVSNYCLLSFSCESTPKGFCFSSVSSCHSCEGSSESGLIGTTGTARINSSSTRSMVGISPLSGTSSGSICSGSALSCASEVISPNCCTSLTRCR